MHEVLVNRLGGLSLPRKSVVRLTDRPDMTLDVYCGRKTTIQPTNPRSAILFRCSRSGGDNVLYSRYLCPGIYWAHVSLIQRAVQTAEPNLLIYKSVERLNTVLYFEWKFLIFYIILFSYTD